MGVPRNLFPRFGSGWERCRGRLELAPAGNRCTGQSSRRDRCTGIGPVLISCTRTRAWINTRASLAVMAAMRFFLAFSGAIFRAPSIQTLSARYTFDNEGFFVVEGSGVARTPRVRLPGVLPHQLGARIGVSWINTIVILHCPHHHHHHPSPLLQLWYLP